MVLFLAFKASRSHCFHLPCKKDLEKLKTSKYFQPWRTKINERDYTTAKALVKDQCSMLKSTGSLTFNHRLSNTSSHFTTTVDIITANCSWESCKTQNSCGRVLKSEREGRQRSLSRQRKKTFIRIRTRITSNFSSESMEASRKWSEISKMLEEKYSTT